MSAKFLLKKFLKSVINFVCDTDCSLRNEKFQTLNMKVHAYFSDLLCYCVAYINLHCGFHFVQGLYSIKVKTYNMQEVQKKSYEEIFYFVIHVNSGSLLLCLN